MTEVDPNSPDAQNLYHEYFKRINLRLKGDDDLMRQPKECNVSVKVVRHAVPSYIQLINRHFEKEPPNGVQGKFEGPIDMLKLTMPPDLLKEVEGITLVYQKKT